MRGKSLAVLSCAAMLALTVSAEEPKEKVAVKPIDLKGMMLKQVEKGIAKPTVITTEEEMYQSVPEAKDQAKVEKQVNFNKQKLIFFAWSGSGQDKLTAQQETKDGKTEILFVYKAGLTRDYRPHFQMFVIDKSVVWKFQP